MQRKQRGNSGASLQNKLSPIHVGSSRATNDIQEGNPFASAVPDRGGKLGHGVEGEGSSAYDISLGCQLCGGRHLTTSIQEVTLICSGPG